MPRALAASLMAGLVLAALGAGAWGYAVYFRPPPLKTLRAVAVGGQKFAFRGDYLRPASRDADRADDLELAAFYPGFAPAGDTRDVGAQTDLGERLERIVFITLRPADGGLDPAERMTKLYARFLDSDEWTHPGGLAARAFQPGSPFEKEELYYVAPDGRAFAARCQQPDQARKTPNTCASEFRIDGLDVELRFSAALLADWEPLSAGARSLIETARR